jgi:hypothetical protein
VYAESASTILYDDITSDVIDHSSVLREYKDFQVGDSDVISDNEDGILRITCIEAEDVQSRSGINTSRRVFDITNSLFGINYHVVTVEMVCEWYADGMDGFVISLSGTYSDVRLGWSCSWEPAPSQYDGQYVHTRILDIYHGTNTYYQFFSGAYNPWNETLSIDTY